VLTYKKATCSAIECSRDAYVALVLWATRRDKVWYDDIRDRVGVAPIEEKLIQHRLRWFGHVQQRPPEAPVRSGVLKRADNVKSGRDRPKLTWDKSVKRDFKEWNISKDLVMDMSAWRLAINVPEP
jgi:hypothetical protein